MDRPGDLALLISRLKTFGLGETSKPAEYDKAVAFFDEVFNSKDGTNLLKQQNKFFELFLPVFVRTVLSSDTEEARACFKHFDKVLEVFRSKLPIKRSGWWRNFEADVLVKCIPKLSEKIALVDESWVKIWIFMASLIINDSTLATAPLNSLLSISEIAFKNGKDKPEVLDQAWMCWVALIDAFGRAPKVLLPAKTTNLLLKPLTACHSASKYRISTWIHMIAVKGLPCQDTLKQLVELCCKTMYKSQGDKAICRQLPDECAECLIKLLSYGPVVDSCLASVIDVFGDCVSSQVSAGAIEKFVTVLVEVFNNSKDSSLAFEHWKSVIGQYEHCSEIPKLACQVLFTNINFQRWVESGTIEAKDISELMVDAVFREKVLLRCILSISADENYESNTPKKKSKRGSLEIWSTYCEVYISWCSNQCPPASSKKLDSLSPDSSTFHDHGSDYLAMQALLLFPIHQTTWDPALFKTWTLLCTACQKQFLLPLVAKPIFDALVGKQFYVQKSIDILNFLCNIDNSTCKFSGKILEKLCSKVDVMDVKNVMDILSVLEIAVFVSESSLIISKLLKSINEKCAAYDQLNAHKIRTKVGKISRKLENSNSAEKEKTPKSPRTPFRTQSNFLQRLAKAEEKNKTKSNFLTSIFSSNDRNKIEEGDNVKDNTLEVSSQDASQEIISKPIDETATRHSFLSQEDSENVPILLPLVSPSTLRENSSSMKNIEGGTVNGFVAEKENVIIPSATSSPTVPSPIAKMKITNARELKTPDALSPTLKKPKPVAGQKTTPKKVTPSKVSYFDDDASDCVMVAPKPKTTPLTEHQMEMMNKRRTDIPALYQDLSQDTQLSNNPPVDVVVRDVPQSSPHNVIPESEEIVCGSQLPKISAPEHFKDDSKTGMAEKMNNSLLSTTVQVECIDTPDSSSVQFTSASTPTKNVLKKENVEEALDLDDPDDSLMKISDLTSPKEKAQLNDSVGQPSVIHGKQHVDPPNDSEKFTGDNTKCKLKEETTDDVKSLIVKNEEHPSTPETCVSSYLEQSSKSNPESKGKRKRKSEPSKFSPKLTRSKKSLKVKTPDANCKLSFDELNKEQFAIPKIEIVSPEKFNITKCTGDTTKGKGFGASESSSLIVADSPQEMEMEEPLASEIVDEPLTSQIIFQSQNEIQELSGTNPEEEPTEVIKKRGRKRKSTDDSIVGSIKKGKTEDKATPLSNKKGSSKKKANIKLCNNLENWLLKTERTTSSLVGDESFSTLEKIDKVTVIDSAESKIVTENDCSAMDNSEEIVPSTQDTSTEVSVSLLDTLKSVSSVVIDLTENFENCKELNTPRVGGVESHNDIVSVIEEVKPLSPENIIVIDTNPKFSVQVEKPGVVDQLCSPGSDDIELLNISPSKRQKEAESLLTVEKDDDLLKENMLSDKSYDNIGEEFAKHNLRYRSRISSPSKPTSRKSLHHPSGRSAKMLRLAANSPFPDEDLGLITPRRKRESIAPITYGDNWPRGPTEEWVACTPVSPFFSPCRGVLKKTPLLGDDDCTTPQRILQDSLTSPLVSSATKKRVVFLDPPVTKGLVYERGSPHGAVHLADVPRGSPYPTWKRKVDMNESLAPGDDDNVPSSSLNESPPKDTTNGLIEVNVYGSKCQEVPRDMIDVFQAEPNSTTQSHKLNWNNLKDDFNLQETFMGWFAQLDEPLQDLIGKCFYGTNMLKMIDEWKVRECRIVCELPHSMLSTIKNKTDEVLYDVLKEAKLPALSVDAQKFDMEVQTEHEATSSHTQTLVPTLEHTDSQTHMSSISLNTTSTNTESSFFSLTDKCTQADLALPSVKYDLGPILKTMSVQEALNYFSGALKLLSSQQCPDNQKETQ